MKKQRIFLFLAIIIVIFAVYKIVDTIKLNKTSNIIMTSKSEGKSLTISIAKGEQYLHKFQVNSFINIKTPPQFAVWIENLNGNYVETLYATSKIVNESWGKATDGGSKRREALPYWTHKRSNNKISTDAVSSATPKGSSIIETKINEKQGKYIICAEVNMSTDFNEYYPKNAVIGGQNYSGGALGSGQPALVYSANIDLNSKNRVYELKLNGHSSPDGNDGKLYEDLSKLTTAKSIIKNITVNVE